MKSFTFLTENRKPKTENRLKWTEDLTDDRLSDFPAA